MTNAASKAFAASASSIEAKAVAPDRAANASARARSGSTVAVTVVRSARRSMASWCHAAIAPQPTNPR